MNTVIEQLTHGPACHFFGYYDMTPWNGSESHLLCLEAETDRRMPLPNEVAGIGLVDATAGGFEAFAETRAWNVQQGAMLHWHPQSPDDVVMFNDIVDNQVRGVTHNLPTGDATLLPRAISAVSPTGTHMASVTYSRLARVRKVVGYAGVDDPFPDQKHPREDGLFVVNLNTLQCELVVSIEQMFEWIVRDHPKVADKDMWFNHVIFNPSGTRMMFLARSRHDDGRLESGLYTCNVDGGDLREVLPYGSRVSHFAWRNDEQLLIWAQWPDDEYQFVLATDGATDHEIVTGPWLGQDGHMTFHPTNRDLFAIDSYRRDVILHNLRSGESTHLRRMPEFFSGNGDLRCDLHPRWNRSGTQLCIDAFTVRQGVRQLHVVRDLPKL